LIFTMLVDTMSLLSLHVWFYRDLRRLIISYLDELDISMVMIAHGIRPIYEYRRLYKMASARGYMSIAQWVALQHKIPRKHLRMGAKAALMNGFITDSVHMLKEVEQIKYQLMHSCRNDLNVQLLCYGDKIQILEHTPTIAMSEVLNIKNEHIGYRLHIIICADAVDVLPLYHTEPHDCFCMWRAQEMGSVKCVQWLHSQGYELAIDECARSSNIELIKYVLSCVRPDKISPWVAMGHIAYDHVEAVKLLAGLVCIPPYALEYAILHGSVECARWLFENGWRVQGPMPFHRIMEDISRLRKHVQKKMMAFVQSCGDSITGNAICEGRRLYFNT
jgi:hypothetical protein